MLSLKITLEMSVKKVCGQISLNTNGFGFVENVFVPPSIAQNFTDGETVSLVAAVKENKKRRELGWVALGTGVADVVKIDQFRKRG